MRLRDLQQILEKFTNGQKGTIISDCPVYIETMSGHLEDVRRIEIQESNLIGDSNPARLVIKADKNELFRPKPNTPNCLLYTSPSPRDRQKSRMPSSA